MSYYYNKSSPQVYLAHHGILGMRWGVRRFQDKKGRLTKAGKERYNDNGKKNPEHNGERKKGLTDKQKTALKVGAALAVTALAAYGGYKLKQSGKLDPLIEKGKNLTGDILGKMGDKPVNSLGQASAATQKAGETVKGFKKLAQPESL